MTIKRIVPAVLLSAVLASSAAYAAQTSKSGEIKSINAARHEITLSNGKVFELPKSFSFKRLHVGEKVTVGYKMKHGKLVASKVTAH